MIIGVGTDTGLWVRPNAARWEKVPDSGSVSGTGVLPSGTIIGAGLDGRLYTRATLDARWTVVEDHGPAVAVTDVTVLDDGTILAVGKDHRLYGKKDLHSTWVAEWPGNQDVIAVTTLWDGTLLGVGTDHQLYTRGSLGDNWKLVAGSGSVLSVAVLGSHTIVGVGTDHQLYARAGLAAPWKLIKGSGSVTAVSTLRDGALLGVGLDNQLYYCPELMGGWSQLQGTKAVLAVTTLPDGRFLGVGTDHQLYTMSPGGGWLPVADSGIVLGVTALPDGGIVGVGLDYQLQFRPTLHSRWVEARASQPVIAVAALPGGTFLGVGTDRQMYTRAELGAEWVALPKDREVVAVTALANGTIVGVGTDHQLYVRYTLDDSWNLVPASGDVVGVAEAHTPWSLAPENWLLDWTSRDYTDSAGDGRPWGDGTAMALRAKDRGVPWDSGCLVTPMIGGYDTMEAIRDAFEAAIEDAERQGRDGVPPGHRGCVNIADWLFNGLRDLSTTNAWGGAPWTPRDTAAKDQTALGLVVRMMSAGIVVRLMLWMPTTAQAKAGGLQAHIAEHWSVAAAVQDHNTTLQNLFHPDRPLGTVCLDMRTAAPASASIHQKMITVRVGLVNVGFCGGVDLAFTRRDFGRTANQVIGSGDWQSGNTSPLPTDGWPKQVPAPPGGYPAYPYGKPGRYPEDLPAEVYGSGNRHWHDQHLKLEGPAVATLEEQFAERWIIKGDAYLFKRDSSFVGFDNQVLFTNGAAFSGSTINRLPAGGPVRPTGDALVQMWRTIPLRYGRNKGPFTRGEFTVMAGIAKAMTAAQELITIWDQYLWSKPVVRLLARQLTTNERLRALIVLPPYGTTNVPNEMKYRMQALQTLWDELDNDQVRNRVIVHDAWAKLPDIGIYVHAKVQTYDDALLVAGSANLNRRSLECDPELDCAVLHRQTVRNHLAGLYAWAFGTPWSSGFEDGWLTRYWRAFSARDIRSLVRDPFFTDDVVDPMTPNGIPIPTDGWLPESVFDPTSIGSGVGSGVCDIATCRDDPKAPGRLDEVTYLLERCHRGKDWPYRRP